MNNDTIFKFLNYLEHTQHYAFNTIMAYKKDLQEFYDILKIKDKIKFSYVITQKELEIYLITLRKRSLKPNTIVRKITTVRSFYAFLIDNQFLKENPFIYLHFKTVSKCLPKIFYTEEIQSLFEEIYNNKNNKNEILKIRNIALLEILYGTGIKLNECRNLTISNIDVDNKNIQIKRGFEERYIPFGKQAQVALKRYLSISRPYLIKNNSKYHEYVFVNSKGAKITNKGIEYILNNLVKKGNLKGPIYPQKLRNSFAVHLLDNGANLRTVQKLLGHNSLSTTKNYAYITNNELLKSYKRFFKRKNANGMIESKGEGNNDTKI